MIDNQKIVVVLPAYNAENTLVQTHSEIPFDIVDELILVDDGSNDQTLKLAQELNIDHIISHPQNWGYGANQKSCYQMALTCNADIVVMLHPDYQYTPKLIKSMAYLISNNVYDVVLGSRILGKGAIKGGMPVYKYFFNRVLTLIQNILMSQKLSEYHTGYRAFSREVLESVNFEMNSNDFVFDNQMLAQICFKGFSIGEISCPTRYFKEASSINFTRSIKYGLGVLWVSVSYLLHKLRLFKFKIFA